VDIESRPRSGGQLVDPGSGETQRCQHRAAAPDDAVGEPLVGEQLALPAASGVEQVDHLVRLEEAAPRLREPHPATLAARRIGVEQLVLDGVVEHLGEAVEHHVDPPSPRAHGRAAGRAASRPRRH
jgi:hypothetical protein